MDAMTQIRGSESGTLVRHGLPPPSFTHTLEVRVHACWCRAYVTRIVRVRPARVNARCVSKRA